MVSPIPILVMFYYIFATVGFKSGFSTQEECDSMCMAVSWIQAKASIELTMLFYLRNFFNETFHQTSLLIYLSTVKGKLVQ